MLETKICKADSLLGPLTGRMQRFCRYAAHHLRKECFQLLFTPLTGESHVRDDAYIALQNKRVWSKNNLSKMDSVCIDAVLLSMRLIAAACITTASRFAKGTWALLYIVQSSHGARSISGLKALGSGE